MFSNGKNPFAIGGGMKNQLKHRHICVMGYRSVGKSSLTIQYVKGEFAEAYDPTIENSKYVCLFVPCYLIWFLVTLNF